MEKQTNEKTDKNENQTDIRSEFRRIDPKTLIEVLEAESVHTAAIVIASLEKSQAASLLENLKEDKRVKIFAEIAQGERISEEFLNLTLSDRLTKVQEIESKHYVTLGGLDFASQITELLQLSTERQLIKKLEETDDDLAEEIKKRIFVFEDIVILSDREIQRVLREIESNELAKALKDTTDEVQEKFFRSMSKKAAGMLKEDMEFMGPIREKDRDQMQMEIVSIIRRLEEKGEIVISGYSDEAYIV